MKLAWKKWMPCAIVARRNCVRCLYGFDYALKYGMNVWYIPVFAQSNESNAWMIAKIYMISYHQATRWMIYARKIRDSHLGDLWVESQGHCWHRLHHASILLQRPCPDPRASGATDRDQFVGATGWLIKTKWSFDTWNLCQLCWFKTHP